ncbi:MAG: hypothetical protein WCA95_17375 [Opitutaceae bacterium]
MLLLVSALVANICPAQNKSLVSTPPDPERETVLALPWGLFDQTEDSGWRTLSSQKKHLEAAKLIEAYLDRHHELSERQRALSNFHAGMQYVFFARDHGGDPRAGIPDLEKAIVSGAGTGLPVDWNDLVIATKAFLMSDRPTLLAVRGRVTAMPPGAARWLTGC